MPKTTFKTENKQESGASFPTLKLGKDERARILCIETEPEFQYAHRLAAPRIVNGRPEMQVLERKNGEKYEDYVTDFVGMPICLGDIGILQDRGVDPQNCPICAESVKSDIVTSPQRRFAMHVLRYAIRPGGFQLAEPFSVSVVVWRFTDTIFNKLVDFAEEWGSLQRHDLLLGPCTNPTYQKYEISIAQTAEWLKSEDRKRIAAITYKENQAKDLADFCGRRAERRWIEADLETVRHRFELARNFGKPQAPEASPERPMDLAAGLDDLLSQVADAPVPAGLSAAEDNPFLEAVAEPAGNGALPAEASADFRDLVKDEPAPASAPEALIATQDALTALLSEPVAPAAPATPASQTEAPKEDVVDFDQLLAGLED